MRNGFTETAAWSPSSNFYRMKAWGGRYVAKSVANELTTTKRIVTEKVEKIIKLLTVPAPLTLFEARVGQFVPRYHTLVYTFHRSRARLTKIGDFVSFSI